MRIRSWNFSVCFNYYVIGNLCNCINFSSKGLDAGRKLGVEPVLSAHDLARPDVEHLGPMAYIANFQWIKPKECAIDNIRVRCDVNNTRVNKPVSRYSLYWIVTIQMKRRLQLVFLNLPENRFFSIEISKMGTVIQLPNFVF